MGQAGRGRRVDKRSGLTLIEVLVSVVILSLGLVAVYGPLLMSLGAMEEADSRLEAGRLLSNHIWLTEENVLRARRKPDTGKTGILMGSEKTYPYVMAARALDGEETLYQANFALTWKGAFASKRLLRSVYVLAPRAEPLA